MKRVNAGINPSKAPSGDYLPMCSRRAKGFAVLATSKRIRSARDEQSGSQTRQKTSGLLPRFAKKGQAKKGPKATCLMAA